MKEKIINWLIKNLKIDTNKISDGYHTFEELYDHRISLYISLCKIIQGYKYNGDLRNIFPDEKIVWRSLKHSDGSVWNGWFLLGINTRYGKQITYHLPINRWDDTSFADTRKKAPKFDGHTPEDVIKRLKEL